MGLGPRSLKSGTGVSEGVPWSCYWEWGKQQIGTNCSHGKECPCPGKMHYCVTLTGKGCKQEEVHPVSTPFFQLPSLPPVPLLTELNQGTNLQRRNLVSESQLRPEKRDVHQGGDSQIISSLSINKKGHCDHGLEVIYDPYWQWLTSFRARKHFHPLWKYT